MPQISEEKIKKIEEQIIYHLYSIFPKQVFTSDIARELARDEEFIKRLLIQLEKKGLIVKITQNNEGIRYERRLRWRLSNKIQQTYHQMQE
ncbi:MAG: putative transcriptional regulator with HTH domain [Patescibacteria group bacterium]|jgi:predicted transcriptional regulator with HTH domain